ncbi:MAG: DUF1570 domain-containing protein [Phycisphaerales bacterium]|nr:DUF1570 domain-containing protein [Phycisphaerales bacterium]
MTIFRPMILIMLAMLPWAGCTQPSRTTNDPTPPSANPSLGTRTVAEDEDGRSIATEPWLFNGVQGQRIETPNFEIYTTLENERLRSFLPRFYEASLDQYMTVFGELPPPPNPLTSFIFGDRRQWMNKTRMMLPEMSGSFETLGRGGYTYNAIAVLYDIDKYQWDQDTLRLAAHEGWHQYAQTTFEHQLPPWLDEAIATIFEGFRFRRGELRFSPDLNRERRYRLREAVRTDTLIPLQDIIESDPHEALAEGKSSLLTYYAQVWALARYLNEGEDGKYQAALRHVLLLAAQGDLYRQLLRHAAGDGRPATRDTMAGRRLIEIFFNEDFDAFSAGYDAWIQQLVRTRSW